MITANQPKIFDTAKVRIVVSSKQDGTVKSNSADDIAEVTKNIQAVAVGANFAFDHVVAMNVGAHADVWDEIVAVAEAPDHAFISLEDRVVADALVATRTDCTLMLPVADCNAVAIHDPVSNVLAVVHLGWQSTAANLATKIIEYLQREYQSTPEHLRIYVSPSIRVQSYVFEEVSQADDPRWKPFLHTTDKGVGIDLPGYNRQRFIEAGVRADNIEVCQVDTATSENYFSHYRAVRTGEPDGRFALFATLS